MQDRGWRRDRLETAVAVVVGFTAGLVIALVGYAVILVAVSAR